MLVARSPTLKLTLSLKIRMEPSPLLDGARIAIRIAIS
jgi:hypothetical protein